MNMSSNKNSFIYTRWTGWTGWDEEECIGLKTPREETSTTSRRVGHPLRQFRSRFWSWYLTLLLEAVHVVGEHVQRGGQQCEKEVEETLLATLGLVGKDECPHKEEECEDEVEEHVSRGYLALLVVAVDSLTKCLVEGLLVLAHILRLVTHDWFANVYLRKKKFFFCVCTAVHGTHECMNV